MHFVLLVQNHCESLTFDPERGAAQRSHHVGVSKRVKVAAGRKLLRPVDDGRLEEATTTQVEEGQQVPHDAHTAGTGDGRGQRSESSGERTSIHLPS